MSGGVLGDSRGQWRGYVILFNCRRLAFDVPRGCEAQRAGWMGRRNVKRKVESKGGNAEGQGRERWNGVREEVVLSIKKFYIHVGLGRTRTRQRKRGKRKG